jgi:CubicO group peptidase (beta-lactamase class C family)
MRSILRAVVVLLLCGLADAAAGPRDVSALLAPIRAKHDLPAMAGAVVVGDAIEAIGVDGVRERGKPEKATVDDQWHLGSCTKAMTATLCAMLVEEGKLSFETTAGKALPSVKMDAAWRDVPLWLFLHHRSGAPANFDGQNAAKRVGTEKETSHDERLRLVEKMFAAPPENPPGTKYLYSNAGFTTAGAMAEQAAGRTWEELMRERLFVPLGMKSAGFGPPGTAKDVDQPRAHTKEGRPVPPGPGADNPPAIGPAGTVHCSIADWAKFVSPHLRGETKEHARLLKPETFVKLHEPVGDEPKYAAGWVVMDRAWAGGRTLMHNGSNTMWYCTTWLAPAKDFAVLVTCNQGGDEAAKACDEACAALIQDHVARAKDAKAR